MFQHPKSRVLAVLAGAVLLLGVGQSSAEAVPTTIDSDVVVSVADPGTSTSTNRVYDVVTGHLTLTRNTGSTTKYTGTLRDYRDGSAYPATANTSDLNHPILNVGSSQGSFKFKMSRNFGKSSYSAASGLVAPAALHVPASDVDLAATQHTSASFNYHIRLTELSGPIQEPLGYRRDLRITYDANRRISGGAVSVTDENGLPVSTVEFTGTGLFGPDELYVVAPIDGRPFALYARVNDILSFEGHAVSGTGAGLTQWHLVGFL